MIVSFRFKNFKSYKDEAVFSFEAIESDFLSNNLSEIELKDGEKIRLLKSAVIFGANASGKSNIIWALHALIYLVANSRNFDVRTLIPTYFPYLSGDSQHKPTEMSLDFIVNKQRYRYEIAYDSNLIHSEKLELIKLGESILVYDLSLTENKHGKKLEFGAGYTSTTLDMSYITNVHNHLLLSEMGIRPKNGLQDVYGAIVDMKAYPIADVINLKAINDAVANEFLSSDSSILSRVKQFMKIADLGIYDLSMLEHQEEDFQFPDSIPDAVKSKFIADYKWEINIIHKNSVGEEFSLPMQMESTGTKYLLGMSSRVFNVLKTGGVLAYDEMNIATHPELFKLIVSLFNSNKYNTRNAQLIFTTHDASIAADNLLRADQVWFAEKDENGFSELYSAQDFDGVDIKLPFDKWYQNGRFGALPKFGCLDFIFSDETKEKN